MQNFSRSATLPLTALALISALFYLALAAHGMGINAEKLQATLVQKFGPAAAQKFTPWKKLVDESRQAESAEQKLRDVNVFFNHKIQFVDDIEAWKQSDYWATPMETLGNEKGDCEDFAIAKYFTLQAANIDVSKLRLIYVKARIGGADSSIVQAHMVLAYYPSPEAEPWILDNMLDEIRPASKRPDLTPVFSFNSQGIWAGVSANAGSGTGTSRLSRWQDLLTRAKAEGFE